MKTQMTEHQPEIQEKFFETTGLVDAAYLETLSAYLTSKGSKWIRLVMTLAISAVMVIIFLNNGNYWLLAGAVAYPTVMLPLFAKANRHVSKAEIRQFNKENPEGGVWFTTWFTEDEGVAFNRKGNIKAAMPYFYMSRLIETAEHFTVFNKNHSYLPVFKKGLSPEQQEAFVAFMKDKCVNLKVIREAK